MSRLIRLRTVIVVVLGFIFVLVGYLASGSRELLAQNFGTFAGTIATLAGIAAAKSGVEHLAGGGGLRGAAKALLTEAKPEPPAEPKS